MKCIWSTYLTIYLFTCLKCRPVNFWICLPVHHIHLYFFYLFTYLPLYMSTYQPVTMLTYLSYIISICLSYYLSICLPVYLSSCLRDYLSTCLHVYLSSCLRDYLSSCLPVELFTCSPVIWELIISYEYVIIKIIFNDHFSLNRLFHAFEIVNQK